MIWSQYLASHHSCVRGRWGIGQFVLSWVCVWLSYCVSVCDPLVYLSRVFFWSNSSVSGSSSRCTRDSGLHYFSDILTRLKVVDNNLKYTNTIGSFKVGLIISMTEIQTKSTQIQHWRAQNPNMDNWSGTCPMYLNNNMSTHHQKLEKCTFLLSCHPALISWNGTLLFVLLCLCPAPVYLQLRASIFFLL